MEFIQHINSLYYQNFRIKKQNFNNHQVPIPLNIYQTWETSNLPPKMQKCIDNLKHQNPEFKHYLFDHEDRRKFIKNNFTDDVVWAYDNLIPGAYKADLWRYCVLYKNGGFYLDIKLSCINGFKLKSLADSEHFCIDRLGHFAPYSIGISNALIVSLANNPLLLDCIRYIVINVRNRYFGYNPLYPTGPGLMGNTLLKYPKYVATLDISNEPKCTYLVYNGLPIISLIYPGYRQEYLTTNNPSYHMAWNKQNIYDTIKPINIKFRTIPPNLFQIATDNKHVTKHPKFRTYIHNDQQRRNFIQTYFSDTIIKKYDQIDTLGQIELWSYCGLYLMGGIFIDNNLISINQFDLRSLLDHSRYCVTNDHKIYKGLLICQPREQLLFEAINQTKLPVLENYFTIYQLNNSDLIFNSDTQMIEFNQYNILVTIPDIKDPVPTL